MTSSRTVFVGTPAFLGRIDGVTRCAFWTGDPVEHDFDPARLLSVDLARTPSAAAAAVISWADVEVDDCFSGPDGDTGGSTLGPAWPELHLTGAVYLATDFIERLPAAVLSGLSGFGGSAVLAGSADLADSAFLAGSADLAGFAGQPFERQSVVYWPGTDDPRAGNRYAGHCAEVLEQRGTLARVGVYPPGRSTDPATSPVTMWLDLASPEHCDAGPDSLTTIGGTVTRGALFLIAGRVSSHLSDLSDSSALLDSSALSDSFPRSTT
ncbi:hypothetical protein OHA72_24620 [Dactylosporangium sp. NBC_01737]|uniref:hypothetical protein n=1 Tax=Dactylosporangium sp. NBC_01737 TaxID=2975959 RepID=UPI002E118046|nr:hypothetical protein OHA72_24620 [Dactylosporangium sp. NBC_01737]